MAFNIREIFKALADDRVEYVVVGGFAVIMHGHLRATRDLDLVIGLHPDNCAKGMEALSRIGLRPRLPVTLARIGRRTGTCRSSSCGTRPTRSGRWTFSCASHSISVP
jgi:hypothetical protein